MFVLEIVGKDEYVVTYNVDQGNVQTIPENTIWFIEKKNQIPYTLLMHLTN